MKDERLLSFIMQPRGSAASSVTATTAATEAAAAFRVGGDDRMETLFFVKCLILKSKRNK